MLLSAIGISSSTADDIEKRKKSKRKKLNKIRLSKRSENQKKKLTL
jgi:hypothetical protein